MVRLACVDVADLALQLLIRKHPGWSGLPAVVVSKDSPYGTILTANARAREYGIEPGMRYAGALSLNHELRADMVSGAMIQEGTGVVMGVLRGFSPQVEAWDSEPGVFWLDAAGMASLFPDPGIWCASIRSSLASRGFTAAIAAGFSRFGCYAAAKSTEDQVIFNHPRSERDCALAAGIRILRLPPAVLGRLEMLGVRTVSAFLGLPPGAVGKRFGPEVEGVQRFAAGDLEVPLQPAGEEVEPRFLLKLPYAEFSIDRLVGYMRSSLEGMTAALRGQHRLVRELCICLVLEEEELPLEPILPSAPCADSGLLTELITLRLENLRLRSAAVAVRFSAATVTERNIQVELFSGSTSQARQSRQEVDKVFARLRAIFGNGCIQRARLEDEHLPELAFSWEELRCMAWDTGKVRSAPDRGEQAVQENQAVRRIFFKPRAPDLPRFTEVWGPYPLSGHWWRGEQPRDYYYAETPDGEILWLYRERADGPWRQIGLVE